MTIPNDTINVCQSVTNFGRGLTKREYFAAMAMQGLLVNFHSNGLYGNTVNYPMVEQAAVIQADALINALNQPES